MLHFASSLLTHQQLHGFTDDFTGRVKDDTFEVQGSVEFVPFDSPYASPSWDSPQLPPQPSHLDLDTQLPAGSHHNTRERGASEYALAGLLSSDCERVAKLRGIANARKQHIRSAPASVQLERRFSSANSYLDSQPVLREVPCNTSTYSANDLIELARKLIANENDPVCTCGEC